MLVNSFLSSKDWNTADIDVSWRSTKILCGFVSCVPICITYVIGVQLTNEKKCRVSDYTPVQNNDRL